MNRLKKTFYLIKYFGLFYFLVYAFTFFFKRKRYVLHKLAIKKVEKIVKPVLETYEHTIKSKTKLTINKNIFVFWAQGFNAKGNVLLNECLKSIEKFYPDFNLIKIDLKNYSKYVHINEKIVYLLNNKFITVQCFSDVLRVNLLYKYGGYWFDATIINFSRLPLDTMLLENNIFTLNNNSKTKIEIWGKVCDITYTSFFIGAVQNEPTMGCICDMYNLYFSKYPIIIGYFLIDYFLIICLMHNISDGALKKVKRTKYDPFAAINYITGKSDLDVESILKCPQKMDRSSFDYDRYLLLKEKIKDASNDM